ncbi:MAG: hypothetical protein ACM3XO_15945 [Bacteroidota bacterium]
MRKAPPCGNATKPANGLGYVLVGGREKPTLMEQALSHGYCLTKRRVIPSAARYVRQ